MMFTCVLYFYQKTIVFFGRTRVYCSYLFMIYYMLMFNYVQVVLSFLLILEKLLLPGDGSEMVLLDELSLVILFDWTREQASCSCCLLSGFCLVE